MPTITSDHATHDCPSLAEAQNGLVSPLYFPRQLVLAEDLTLDRTSRDAELERARRLLHGWGVVAGLIPVVEGDDLTVSRGYAVTPTGAEVYLAGDLTHQGIEAAVRACCGADAGRCSPDRSADEEAVPLITWLVARPTDHDSALRPEIPEGCRHPANTLRPTRRCAGVRLELVCDLPASHTATTDPATLHAIACGTLALEEDATLLPMPELPGPEAEFVVLGQLAVVDEEVDFRVFGRRALLPTQVLQEWIVRRTCQVSYYVNRVAQPNGDHELHVDDCFLRTSERNRVQLGEFTSPADAAAAAREAGFATIDGCRFCLPTLHRR
jgi:hypothetical protein